MSELGVFMAKLSKSRMVWAINETQSMRQASKLCGVAYNTFKKYAKLYDIWAPLESNAGISQGSSGGLKPVELEDIFAGKNPSYSTTKLLHRCFREGYLAEECSNCGYDEYRPSDMTKPLMLDYLDDDQTNRKLRIDQGQKYLAEGDKIYPDPIDAGYSKSFGPISQSQGSQSTIFKK